MTNIKLIVIVFILFVTITILFLNIINVDPKGGGNVDPKGGGNVDPKGGGKNNGNSVVGDIYTFNENTPNLQQQLDNITLSHGAWCASKYQFTTKRTLILFEPGSYDVTVNVGFYMSIAGLGKSPNDVKIKKIEVRDSSCPPSIVPPSIDPKSIDPKPASTENFWRSVENLTVTEASTWSVSQAAPLRRVIFKGNVKLQEGGWASGGFTSDSIFEQGADTLGNQQWFFRNSNIVGISKNNNWNTVYLNCGGNGISQECRPNQGQRVIINDNNLLTRQKPTLFLDGKELKILRPNATKSSGAPSDFEKGDVYPLDNKTFYHAHPTDSAVVINTHINNGLHIILTPGIYNNLKGSIIVNKPELMVLGQGFATLVSSGDNPCIIVEDNAIGVTIAGILFEAGPTHVKTLLQWGRGRIKSDKNKGNGWAHDIFTRVGGPDAYKTSVDSMVEINSNNITGDNFWLWRADHGKGLRHDQSDFTYNVSTNGLIVNGDNVTMLGLAVEHCQKDLVVWNGENGTTYWYQSEIPYDAPRDWDYLAYYVTDNVTKHTGNGLGAYAFLYQKNPPLEVTRAFKTPITKGIKMSNMLTFNANSNGGFLNIWNNDGIRDIGNDNLKPYLTACANKINT